VDERRAYIDLLAEEFRSLASGSHQAGRHTYTALQWGTAIVGIIVGAAISQWSAEDAVVEFVFLLGVPALVAVGMLFWVGELAGMRRIHEFMCVVEAKADLALRHGLHQSGTEEEWFDSFTQEWIARRNETLTEMRIAVPTSARGRVEIQSGPLAFERWLHAIRNTEASNGLAWVFIVRFALFPSAILASWATGVYYVFFQSDAGLTWASVAAVILGFLLGLVAVWIAGELLADMSQWSAGRSSGLSRTRKAFRDLFARPLRRSEWK
jgi:hypothetical protein